MIYTESQRDLFGVPDYYHLAHCISSDCAMAAGIAVPFSERFSLREKLLAMPESERLHPTCIQIGRVFNLITKDKCHEEPTYHSVEAALRTMKGQMLDRGIKYIAMPKIACGIDRLRWNMVSEIIKEVFCDMDVEILVCYP